MDTRAPVEQDTPVRRRIVHVIVGLEVGGAETMLCRLVLSQRQRFGHEVRVVSLTTEGPLGERLRSAGVDVHALGLRGPGNAPFVWSRLRRFLRRFPPDVVQTWMVHADLLGGTAARSIGVPAIVWGVRNTSLDPDGSRVTRALRGLCARLSARVPDRVVFVAEAARAAHVAIGYDAANAVVIPNGFDTERVRRDESARTRLRAEWGVDQGTCVVGSVGRLHPDKDHGTFFDACERLLARRADVAVVVVGRGLDASAPRLAARLRDTPFAGRVHLLGVRDDVPACLSAFDVFCLHSRTEGFPNVLGEAMACSLPCVTTDVGDAAVLLDDPDRVVPAGDAAALAQGLEELCALSAADRAAHGARARRRIEDEFTLDRAVERFEDVYTRISRDRRAV